MQGDFVELAAGKMKAGDMIIKDMTFEDMIFKRYDMQYEDGSSKQVNQSK